ncbi:hypothetical protein [Flavobacterium sp. JP2137]|uniref:hypothetical protein n=1 Tax=Flavobacterium sp. JP2137 TaxID=3414510 RepID=UPI003D2FF61A
MNGIILGQTYYTISGSEFIPIKKEKGEIKDCFGYRKSSIYISHNGTRIQKGNIYSSKERALFVAKQKRKKKLKTSHL